MKKIIIRNILLLIAIFISSIVYADYQEGFVPTWEVGQRWILEATYKDLRGENDAWLPPMQWIFHVRAKKVIEGKDCYVIHIYGRRSSQENQAILWLSTEDLRPLRVIDVYPTSEGMKYQEKDINSLSSEPLLAEGTPIPYDLPSFPLTKEETRAQSADVFSAYNRSSDNEAKKFSRVRKVGGLSFKKNISQKSKAPDRQYADAFDGYSNQTRNSGQSYQIEIAEDRSNNRIIQLWQQGSPWAISTFSRDRKVRLVPESEYKNGGNNK